LKLKYVQLLSSVAFKPDLRRFVAVALEGQRHFEPLSAFDAATAASLMVGCCNSKPVLLKAP
jgi:hypothetical protein